MYAGQTVTDAVSVFVYGLCFFFNVTEGPKSKEAAYSPSTAGNETLVGDWLISCGALLSLITWTGVFGSCIL